MNPKPQILFLSLFFLCISFLDSIGQVITVRDPTWVAEEAAKYAEEKLKWAQELGALADQVNTAKERLKLLTDATKKLKEVNRRVANFRHLEEAISLTAACYDRMNKFLQQIERDDLFRPDEYRMLASHLMNSISVTSHAINALTIVVTDNFAEMTDAERLNSLNASLLQLRQDVGVFYSFINEVDVLNNQRMQLRTFKYIKQRLE